MGKPPSCDKTAAIRESILISSASLRPFVSEQLLLASLFPQEFDTNATNNTGWQWWNDRLTAVSVNRSHFLHICRFSVFPRITPSEKNPNLSTCDNTSLRAFKHCAHSSTIFFVCVNSHWVLFRPCLFWAEFLCSFPLCCPHTLWCAASCCLTSRPSDTNVPPAHQGVHSQQQGRSPCSSSPSHSVSALNAQWHNTFPRLNRKHCTQITSG